MTKRLKTSIIGGILLGIVCIIGAYIRSNFSADLNFVLPLWYNRVIMGITVGAFNKANSVKHAVVRGSILGLLVSFAFYFSTKFQDPISFVAGIIYGIILEVYLFKKISD